MVKFSVQTNDASFALDPSGFVANDDAEQVPTIESICLANNIPYGKQFVCLHVHKAKRPGFVLPPGRSIQKSGNIYAFGALEIELVPEIVSDIVLVCAGDFQNIILNSRDAGKGTEYLKERINVLEGTVEARMAVLSSFVDKARKYAVKGYAEARIFRALKSNDKLPPNVDGPKVPDSGENA